MYYLAPHLEIDSQQFATTLNKVSKVQGTLREAPPRCLSICGSGPVRRAPDVPCTLLTLQPCDLYPVRNPLSTLPPAGYKSFGRRETLSIENLGSLLALKFTMLAFDYSCEHDAHGGLDFFCKEDVWHAKGRDNSSLPDNRRFVDTPPDGMDLEPHISEDQTRRLLNLPVARFKALRVAGFINPENYPGPRRVYAVAAVYKLKHAIETNPRLVLGPLPTS